ncbi:MAG TPA: hypothetical protein PKI89_02355, partial [Tepidiformaceae bacterium]|nr:hypothetical protein [Tepidiformaceae bacterium]
VVATPVPGFRGASWARLATTVDEFANRIDEALLNPFSSMEVDDLPSWANRAALFATALADARRLRDEKPLKVAYLDHCAQLSGGELANVPAGCTWIQGDLKDPAFVASLWDGRASNGSPG